MSWLNTFTFPSAQINGFYMGELLQVINDIGNLFGGI